MTRFCRDDQITDNQEGKVDPRYIAEVDRMTRRREALHARRERALADLVAAESAAASAREDGRGRATLRAAWDLVHARRAELRRIEALMTANPGASSRHRGTDSIWPVSDPETVQRGMPDRGPRTSDGRYHPVTRSRK